MRSPALILIALIVAGAIHCSSSTNTTTSCSNIAGQWSVSGSCGALQCAVTQSACSVGIGCTLVSYTGTVSGDNLVFQSFDNDGGVIQTCNAAVAGNMVTGTCNTGLSSCSFSAVSR